MAQRFRLSLLIGLLVLASASPAWAAGDLESQLRRMIRAHDLRQTQVAAMVQDLSTGEVLVAIDADEPMIPASNMKLITTAAALDVLGPEFVFRTELGIIEPAPANPAGGATLVVKGDGDPAFGDPELLREHGLSVDDLLDQWAQAVVKTGRTHVDRLLIDDRVFDRTFTHPDWPANQLIKSYCAQVAGLNFHDNCIDVLMTPARRQGLAPTIELFPPAPFLETVNEATTGKTDIYGVIRAPGTNRFVFHGSIRNKPYGPFQATVHDPALFFGNVFAERLRQRGVTVASVERPADDQLLPTPRALHVVQTTLPLVLTRTNRDSQNMFAEALIKRMGRAVTGASGSWENGAAAVRLALRDRLGPRSSVVSIADGSGMSRDNRVTARVLVELLASLHNDADATKAAIYRKSLAHGGVSGTLDDRLQELAGQVYGKSGYLSGVSALSGYLVLPAGPEGGQPRTIAFSFLFNGFEPPVYNLHMKALQDKLVGAIEGALTPAATTGLGG